MKPMPEDPDQPQAAQSHPIGKLVHMTRPCLRSLLWIFLRHGNLTFGGGSATIAELERELVERREWVSQDQSRLSYALSRITPGTNLLAYCVGVGWLLRGATGAVGALLAASIPCSALAVVVTALYEYWSRNALASVALRGALVAAVAVTLATGWTLIRPYRGFIPWYKIVFGSGSSLALAWFGITPLRVLLLAAMVGLFWPGGTQKR